MKKKLSFEEGMGELEQLVEALEAGKMTLDESFKAYERAKELRDALNKLLDEGDKRIRMLTEDGETDMVAEDLQ